MSKKSPHWDVTHRLTSDQLTSERAGEMPKRWSSSPDNSSSKPLFNSWACFGPCQEPMMILGVFGWDGGEGRGSGFEAIQAKAPERSIGAAIPASLLCTIGGCKSGGRRRRDGKWCKPLEHHHHDYHCHHHHQHFYDDHRQPLRATTLSTQRPVIKSVEISANDCFQHMQRQDGIRLGGFQSVEYYGDDGSLLQLIHYCSSGCYGYY